MMTDERKTTDEERRVTNQIIAWLQSIANEPHRGVYTSYYAGYFADMIKKGEYRK